MKFDGGHILSMLIVASVFVAVLLHPDGFVKSISTIGSLITNETALLSTQAAPKS